MAGFGGGVWVTKKAARKIRQTVLHMLMRWKLGVAWVVVERITMERQRSGVGLETTDIMRGDRRKRYIVGSPREWCSPRRTDPALISPER